AQLALKLITELCGGTASQLEKAGAVPAWKRTIALRTARVAELGGVSMPEAKMEAILTALGFACEKVVGGWNVKPPSWRADVEGEADLVEELLRISGYDHIPTVSLPKLPTLGKPALAPMQRRAHIAKRALAARGMMELCTWSFLPTQRAQQFGGGAEALKLLNPINAELDMMRPSLLPNLLEAAQRNANRGFANANLFEVGLTFQSVAADGQKLVAGGIRTGQTSEPRYDGTLFGQNERPADVFDAKADALALLAALGMGKCDITPGAPGWYHPGRSGTLTLGGKVILGHFGELHPSLCAQYDLGAASGFELFLEAIPLPRAKGKARPALKVSDFQAVERDFAFLVDESVSAADITKAIASAEKQLITAISIFDVYAGKGVDAGKKSVAVKVTLQASDRTLSEAEINAASAAIVAAASKAFGGQLRQ
ncbi:MAG: phenylalanine--tRNA ligase subunit beta, partial [Proteobacteria bacterium]|nr:phenylalanine--tRNA ligase subunit beta [Pseudomonadota bacterium]